MEKLYQELQDKCKITPENFDHMSKYWVFKTIKRIIKLIKINIIGSSQLSYI